MADCDISSCCNDICTALETERTEVAAALADTYGNLRPLRDMVNQPEGVFVSTPALPDGLLPSLAETTGRINNFGNGFAIWRFFEQSSRTVLLLPFAPAGIKLTIALNAVRLTEGRDFTVGGIAVSFSYATEPGDYIEVKSYGS